MNENNDNRELVYMFEKFEQQKDEIQKLKQEVSTLNLGISVTMICMIMMIVGMLWFYNRYKPVFEFMLNNMYLLN